jgi:hypothetical protein
MRLSASLLDKKQIGAMIADLILVVYGFNLFLRGSVDVRLAGNSATENVAMFLIVISVVPWYMGYLLHHFEGFHKVVRRIIQWIFGLITLSLIVFLIVGFMPFIEANEAPSGFETFLLSFGMFFLVLGPMMMGGGFADAKSIDSSRDPSQPYMWPVATGVMLIITLAIVYMILFIGLFDPHWEGNANFLVIIGAFLLGPLLSLLTLIPFMIIGKWLTKVDALRLLPKALYIIIPALTFHTLIWWNDIVLFNLSGLWEGSTPSVAQILWSMSLAGIIPFRVIMLFKPPFNWFGLLFGLVAIGFYVVSVLNQYGAI